MKKKNAPFNRQRRFLKILLGVLIVPLVGLGVLQFVMSFPVIAGYAEAYQMRFWQLPSDSRALYVTAEHACSGNSCLVWGHLVVESDQECIDLWDYLDVQNPDETIFVHPENDTCVVTLQIEVD